MPEEAVDFWPDVRGPKPRTPLSIMKQQAALLGKRTSNLLEAEVVTTAEADRLYHRLIIVAPTLDYRYRLLTVSHDVTLYPVEVYATTSHVPPGQIVKDEAAFVTWLKEVLSSEETKKVLGSLLAQVEA